jgi:hypothetical protein
MKKTLLFLFAFVCVLSSCSSEAVSCYLPDITTTSNSPLVPGGTLQLKTPFEDNPELNYVWTGPNNFQSNLPNPIIENITAAMAGEYKLKTTKGICESLESSTLVEINAPNIPCNPNKNTITFEGGSFAPLTFSVYTSNYNTNFKINAGNLQGDLTIEFASEERPAPGIYRICPDCPTSFMEKDQVCISFNYIEYSVAREGLVYLSSSNGKLTAVFCNVIFTPSIFTLNSSANLTEN